MPWLLTKTNFGRRFKWQSITAALAAVTGGTQARYDTSGAYTNITGLWGFTPPAPPPATTGPTTGATAGTPGTFTGGTPANLAALQALGALGNTRAWRAGQSVTLGDASSAYWNGTAWVVGAVPSPLNVKPSVGTGTVSVSFEFYGLPAAADLLGALPKVSITVQTGGQNLHPAAVKLAAGKTKQQAALQVAAALDGLQDTGGTVTLHAVASGATVTVTEVKGAVITSLTARIT